MRSLIFGLVLIIGFGALSITGSVAQYFSSHAVYLVGGGTVAVFFLTVPWTVLVALYKSLLQLAAAEPSLETHKEALNALSARRDSETTSGHQLIKYANDLWVQGVESDLFIVLLSEKRREIDLRGQDTVQALKNLAKYPPALGMAGTVMGMIGLFSNLDKNRSSIGENLSLAMAATFLGLLLANLVVSPLSDRLQIHQARVQQINGSIYELLLLINRGESRTLISEEIDGRAA